MAEAVHLNHCVRIYCPSTTNIDTQASATLTKHYVDLALSQFSAQFGGATAYNARGAWLSPTTNALVTEDVTIVESFCDSDSFARGRQSIMDLAHRIKNELAQDAVSVQFDLPDRAQSGLYLV